MKLNKKKSKKKVVKSILITLVIIFVITLIIILTIQYHPENILKINQNQEKVFLIRDECSLIMGQIIHEIRDKDECRIRCINECRLEKLNIDRSNFILGNNSCHSCNCYCKS